MTETTRPAGDDITQALVYAIGLLDAEQARSTEMAQQSHRLVVVAWPWFAVVQLVVIVACLVTSDRYDSDPWIAVVLGGVAALCFTGLVISTFRFSSVAVDDGSLPASLLDGLILGNAATAEADQASVIAQSTARQLQDRRRANAIRAERLRDVQSGWLATMLVSLIELAAAIAVIAHAAS